MRRSLPTIAVALLSAGLLVHAPHLATPAAQAGPFRKAARAAKAAGTAVAHAIPGHARRVERRKARMIGEYYGTLENQPLVNSQPIGQFYAADETKLMAIKNQCPGGVCPYGTLPLRAEP
jgi:hypothetical protein